MVVYGTPGLPLIQLIREPQELMDNTSLRINAVYYINKQVLPALNRVLALVGVDVFSWFDELPRRNRVSVPIATDKKKVGGIETVCEGVNKLGAMEYVVYTDIFRDTILRFCLVFAIVQNRCKIMTFKRRAG